MSAPVTSQRIATPDELQIRRMRSSDLTAVAEILELSFGGKMAAAMPGRPEAGARLMAEAALLGRDAWVADDGGVIGLLTLQDSKRPWFGHAQWSLVRRVRPLRRALRALIFLILFHSVDFAASELYLETMAVHPVARGQGVGSALLRFADEEARRRGRTSVSLYCIRDNPSARALYVRYGYRIVRSEDLWWCSPVLGFRITDQMRRELPWRKG